jgi:MFS family permease
VLDAAGYAIIAPVVPAIAAETSTGPALMGVLVAGFAAGMAAGFWIAGRAVEARGASLAVVGGLAITALGAAGFVVGGSFAVYLASRLVMGVGSGGLWIGATFAIIERFPGQEYRCLTGLLAAYSVGGVGGPALGAIGGIRGPFLAYLALAALAGAAFLTAGGPVERVRFSSDRSPLGAPGFRLASAGILLVAVAIGTFDGTLPLHFGERLSQAEIAGLYVAASMVVGASAVAAGRVDPRGALATGCVAIVAGIALAGIGASVPVWLLAVAVTGVGFGAGEAGALGVLLQAVGTRAIVLAMVVWSQLWAVGYLIGPAVGGAVAETLGFAALGLVPLAAAVFVVVAWTQANRAGRRQAASPL